SLAMTTPAEYETAYYAALNRELAPTKERHETRDASGLEKDHVRTREDEFSERSRFAAQEMNRRRASRSAWHTCRAQRKAPLWSRHATVAQDEGGT
ncbi:hypothetical protein ACTHRA_11700, partial [Micrococcus luteus]|uniref:hypothetical protein n=1 Tax=Micrococcus luteus TaxID=1270 RepID=UPI003F814F1F